nr:MAG TPA: hypothetical protein [Caudoviricetes sp.]
MLVGISSPALRLSPYGGLFTPLWELKRKTKK